MYYVIYHYKEGRQDLAIKGAAYEADIINFIHDNYKEIGVHRILEVKAEYRLGLVVTKDYVRSELEPGEETESLVPVEVIDNAKAILREKKKKLKQLETEEPSAMEKIIDETEEEMTDDEKLDKQIDKADQLIEREEKREEQKKKGWKLCGECNSNRISPANKKGICTPCQKKRKTTRPYIRHKEFKGL